MTSPQADQTIDQLEKKKSSYTPLKGRRNGIFGQSQIDENKPITPIKLKKSADHQSDQNKSHSK